MHMRTLGGSGIKVSPLAVGCWSFGGGAYWGEQSQQSVDAIVASALERGVNLFDTAAMYNDGNSEISLGISLKGKRDQAVICSKLGPHVAYRDEMIRQCEMSLKRLQTDYLDCYMLHWPINPIAIKHFTDDEAIIAHPPTVQEAFEAFETLKRDGKIRAIGISNFGVQQMAEAQKTGVAVDVNEMPYNIFTRAIEYEILPYCMEKEIAVVCSMALQQGILAGAYQRSEDIPHNQAHSRHFHFERGKGTSRHDSTGVESEMFAALGQLREIAASMDISMAQLAIAWLLHRPGIASVLAGSRTTAELEDNLKAMDVSLKKDVVERIDGISEAIKAKMGSNPDLYESEANRRII
jgi:aryl-alcohol dehydrogenase-like predicted oxidoreductase